MYKSIDKVLNKIQIIIFNNKLDFNYRLVDSNKKRLGTIYDYCSHKENTITIPFKLFSLSNEDIIKVFIFELLYVYCINNNIKAFNLKNGYYKKDFQKVGEYFGIQLNFLQNKGYVDVELNDKLLSLVVSCNFDDIKESEEYVSSNEKKEISQWRYFCPICNGVLRGTKNMKIKCLKCNTEMINTDEEETYFQLNNEIVGSYQDKLIIKDEYNNLFYIYGNLNMYDLGDCIKVQDLISIYTLEHDDVFNILQKFKENN